MKQEPLERYNATQALAHPWVSRQKQAEIPITAFEAYKNFDSEDLLRKYLRVVYFASVVRGSQMSTCESESGEVEYRRRIEHVQRKIQDWTEKRAEHRQGRLENDEDFFTSLDHSPSRFDYSDPGGEEEDQEEEKTSAEGSPQPSEPGFRQMVQQKIDSRKNSLPMEPATPKSEAPSSSLLFPSPPLGAP